MRDLTGALQAALRAPEDLSPGLGTPSGVLVAGFGQAEAWPLAVVLGVPTMTVGYTESVISPGVCEFC